MTDYKSRKFILTLLVILLTAAGTWYGKLTGAVYENIVVYGLGIYVAGNVSQKFLVDNFPALAKILGLAAAPAADKPA